MINRNIPLLKKQQNPMSHPVWFDKLKNLTNFTSGVIASQGYQPAFHFPYLIFYRHTCIIGFSPFFFSLSRLHKAPPTSPKSLTHSLWIKESSLLPQIKGMAQKKHSTLFRSERSCVLQTSYSSLIFVFLLSCVCSSSGVHKSSL